MDIINELDKIAFILYLNEPVKNSIPHYYRIEDFIHNREYFKSYYDEALIELRKLKIQQIRSI